MHDILFRDKFIITFLWNNYKIPSELTIKYIINNLPLCYCNDLNDICYHHVYQLCLKCSKYYVWSESNIFYHYCYRCLCKYHKCTKKHINGRYCKLHIK